MALTAGLALAFTLAYFNPPGQVTAHCNVCTTAICTQRAANILVTMNQTVWPCEDFWQYACGGWAAANEGYNSQWGRKEIIVDLRLVNLLSQPITPDDSPAVQVAKTFYLSCTNIKMLKKLGDKPLVDVLNDVFLDFPSDLTSRLIKMEQLTVSPLLAVGVGMDNRNSSRYIIKVYQPNLNLERNQYIGNKSSTTLKKYVTLFAQIMPRLLPGVDGEEVRKRGQRVVQLEVQLAQATMTAAQIDDASDKQHVVTIATLQRRYPQLEWQRYVEGVFRVFGVSISVRPHHPLVSMADLYLDRAFSLLPDIPPHVFRDYLLWRAAFHLIPHTGGRMYRAVATFKGPNSMFPPAKRVLSCAELTKSNLPYVVGDMYSRAHTDAQVRQSVVDITRRVVEATGRMIEGADWLSPPTVRHAEAKLSAMRVEVGAPYVYNSTARLDREFGHVAVHNDTLLLNYLAVVFRNSHLSLLDYHRTRQHVQWPETPAEANAYYLTAQNSIIVPAGILQSSLFSPGLPASLNYGALGSSLGHEVTHGFDAQGHLFDEHGNKQSRWLQHENQHFKERAQCFIDQYGHFRSHKAGASVDGELTLNENLADNGGLTAAYLALDRLLQEHKDASMRLPGLVAMTPSQLFFVAYAQLWCSHESVSSLFCRLKTDEHSPNKYRVLGSIRNHQHFAKAFNCPLGSNMNPEQKCQLW